MTGEGQEIHVVFYDGVCRLCDRTVRFLIGIDHDRILSFAPLQGKTAARLAQSDPRFRGSNTMLLVENHGTARARVSSRSTGILRTLARLGGFWRVVSWLRVVPRPVRDLAYRIVARYRYRWFGRFDACPLPGTDVEGRFLE